MYTISSKVKTLICCMIAVLVPFGATALDWSEDYEAELQLAVKERKGLVLVITAVWCGPCKRLKRDILEKESFTEGLKDVARFVKVEVTGYSPTAEQFRIMNGLKATSFPTLVVIDSDRKVVVKKSGYNKGTVEGHVKSIRKALGW